MVEYMKEVVKTEAILTVEMRNLLSVAYKNVVGARRAAWRIYSTLETQEARQDNHEAERQIIEEYRLEVEKELEDICKDVLALLDDFLIGKAGGGDAKPEEVTEAEVFYLKMAGDYYRYIAEFAKDSKKEEASNNAVDKYKEASALAQGDSDGKPGLPPTHPIRLGLALNFSVFYFEIMGKNEEACDLAKKAFDDAIAELDALSEDSYKDATLIMQLLRDNLTLWTSDDQDQA